VSTQHEFNKLLNLLFQFRDEIFWFPHNMDFRGRVYPCPPHLNHLGADLARAILLFAQGKPLGSKGLDWLKVSSEEHPSFLKNAKLFQLKILVLHSPWNSIVNLLTFFIASLGKLDRPEKARLCTGSSSVR
jgi:hypothetical protein